MDNFPRETNEFLPVIVTLNGLLVLTGVTFADVPDGTRPVSWVAAVSLNGQIGVTVAGYAAGRRRVFAKVVANPEAPVIDCGVYTVT